MPQEFRMKVWKSVMLALIGVTIIFSSSILAGKYSKKKKNHSPRNVILIIADGWGYNQIDAASYYQYGQKGHQIYEHFPVQLGMSTYLFAGGYSAASAWDSFDYVRSGATDSAAAATAMSTGVKTFEGAIGVGPDQSDLEHIIERFEMLGKATGVITSVQWSHATPAGFVAHNVARSNYEEIAREMIYDSAVDVIMGCGHPLYKADGIKKDTPNSYKYVGGESTWNDLLAGMAGSDADGDGEDDPWTLIQTREEFQALAQGPTPERIVGVAQVYQTLQQERGDDKYADPYVVPPIQTVPTLGEMTRAALNVLDNDKDGFFLMVEGGAVDWAGHGNQSGRIIEEEIDFNRSVEAVVNWVRKNSNWGETLVIVTGDHETGYLTGPDSNPEWNPLVNLGADTLPLMEWHSSSHTNQLIPFFAKGRGAKRFKKKADEFDPEKGPYIDNTEIAEIIFDLFDQLKPEAPK
jgi:alkaline phosphatase